MPTRPRLLPFDGARGMAALVVTLWHIVVLLEVYLIYVLPTDFATNQLLRNLSFLNVRRGGDEPVEIFFILSGFALTTPVMYASRKFSWRAYYPSRFLRLYLPALASLVVSVVLLLLVPRTVAGLGFQGDLLIGSWRTFSWDVLLQDANLFSPPPFAANIPLWTLAVEILFSLALPIYLWVGIRAKSARSALLLGGGMVSLSALGRAFELPYLVYLPLFMLGVLIAYHREPLQEFAQRLYNRGRWIPTACVVGTLAVILWWHFVPGAPQWLLLLGQSLYPIGAVAILIITYTMGSWIRFTESRPIQWLGRISFSLYLVHVPVLVTLCYLLGPQLLWLAVLLGLPVSLLVAEGFFWVAEAPLHKLSQRVRNAVLRQEAKVQADVGKTSAR